VKTFDAYLKETGEVGYVQSIISSIFYVSGLPTARLNELVISENGLIGIVKALLPEIVEVMVFEGQSLGHNMRVVRTNEFFQVPVSANFLGRVVDPFGVPQDNLEPIRGIKTFRQTDPHAPGVNERVRISRPMTTGVMAVDMQVPMGMGQRELVLGDQKTGKTTFALQTIVNQARLGTICVYVSIGKKKSDLKFVENFLENEGVLDKTAIVAATSADPAPLVYLAPFSGLSIAEYFRDGGNDVLVVLDDLTTHAKFYREISLLSRRPPGRQSYPGDIFHLHARMAERAGNIRAKNGKEVSITLLPIAETLEGDLAGYIQTNLMAMTDGHIFFDITEAKRGRHPAVSFTLSVSRVGNQTRTPLEREISQNITQKLSEFRKAEELGRFGVELTARTQLALKTYEKLEAILNQESQVIYPKGLQLIFLGIFLGNYWMELTSYQIRAEKDTLLAKYIAGKLDNVKLLISACKNIEELNGVIAQNIKFLMKPAVAVSEK
jgi:F-type H+-transporting ATPase subunit alpha